MIRGTVLRISSQVSSLQKVVGCKSLCCAKSCPHVDALGASFLVERDDLSHNVIARSAANRSLRVCGRPLLVEPSMVSTFYGYQHHTRCSTLLRSPGSSDERPCSAR